jgi:acyl-CoA synthetase (AMP-forming)/AMP-acid ligase II
MGNELALILPRIDEHDAFLVAGPMSHAAGLLVWPVIAAGARSIVMAGFDPARCLELIETEHATMTLLVPTTIQSVANHADARRRDLSSLKAVFYGAAPITERTLEDAQAVWGNIMYQLYGQSESLPTTVLTPRHHILHGTDAERRWLRSAGRPTPNSDVKVLDDDGREVAAGEVGEICSLSPGNMAGIWGDPSATAERFAPGGYVRTRDLGYVDEHGFVYLADRKEDMIISGGFNIWPAEVENALCSHPAVMEAAVVGVPDEKWGETVLAVVVLRARQEATADELISWCREKIGSVKKPTRLEFSADPLPKSGVGKLLRRAVREKYWQGEDRRVHGA